MAGPLLVDLLVLMSLLGPSDALLLIWALVRLILELVCFILIRSSRVSQALALQSDLLLTSRISRSCSFNCLSQYFSSLLRRSGFCAISWSSGVSS